MNAMRNLDITLSRNHCVDRPFSTVGYRRRGFTITELMVVIGIIVLLAGLLLAALGGVRNRALATRTVSIMQGFSAACDAFQTDHGFYPGVIPEEWLAAAHDTTDGIEVVGGGGGARPTTFTSTENALLHLMGGYRVLSPAEVSLPVDHPVRVEFATFNADYEFTFRRNNTGDDDDVWQLKVSLRRIGEGPVINGKAYAPYYTPGSNDIGVVEGQEEATTGSSGDWIRMPELVDGWGQPILYLRQMRTRGRLVGAPFQTAAADRAQFSISPLIGYLDSTNLGSSGKDQVYGESSNPAGSILTVQTNIDRYPQSWINLAQILRHPAFGTYDENPLSDDNYAQVASRGAYAMISAGPDGIFFSATDGPGPDQNNLPVTNLADPDFANPNVIESYDDVIVFGGG